MIVPVHAPEHFGAAAGALFDAEVFPDGFRCAQMPMDGTMAAINNTKLTVLRINSRHVLFI